MSRHCCFLLALLLAACRVAVQQVRLDCQPSALLLFPGESTELTVQIVNHSAYALDSGERFFLSYHLHDTAGKLLRFDNRRFAFPRPIAVGETVRLSWLVFFDLEPGRYRLQWDIVQEGRFWGSQRGWTGSWSDLQLRSLTDPSFRRKHLPTYWDSGNPLIDTEQYLLRLTYKNAERRDGSGSFFGFAAGSAYPAVWIRDTATALAYARCFYPWHDLAAVVEKFLARQKESGEIVDWIDAGGAAGKNTVETDQESSLVLAAYEIGLARPSWLQSRIAGEQIWRRLERALAWVWRYKRDPRTGLLVSGLCADWGDVENSYPDQRAVNLSDRSSPVTGIYTQAKYIQAIDRLLAIGSYLGEKAVSVRWSPRRDFLMHRTRQRLYLPQAGYFLIHRVLTHDRFLDMEKKILALGGNGEAIAAGLMTAEEVKKFLDVLEARRREYGTATVSYSLLPPYATGFFPHPLLSRPWTYQNGGAWDWFGGRLILALFRQGLRRQAERYLLEIIPRHLRDKVLSEWQDRDGNAQGALFYVGTAGVVGEAILRGYFGLSEDFSGYTLTPPVQSFFLRFHEESLDFTASANTGNGGVEVALSRGQRKICLKLASQPLPQCLQKPGKLEAHR